MNFFTLRCFIGKDGIEGENSEFTKQIDKII